MSSSWGEEDHEGGPPLRGTPPPPGQTCRPLGRKVWTWSPAQPAIEVPGKPWSDRRSDNEKTDRRVGLLLYRGEKVLAAVRGRSPTGRKPGDFATHAKRTIIETVRTGGTQADAIRALKINKSLIAYYRRSDAAFASELNAVVAMTKSAGGVKGDLRGTDRFPSFEEFCKEYLDTQLFTHHMQWIDLLEGRPPRDLHPSQIYHEGTSDTILINTPPEHAKSTTLTINYVTYRICQDPNIRIIIVSKTQDMAKKFLRAVKDRLSGVNPAYHAITRDFAPEGGFSQNSAAWTADAIYVSGELRDSGEPSPTVQALGIKGHIYGSRADLILMDDCVDSSNAHDFAKHIDWIQNEVSSRLAYPGGRLLLIGTRLAPVDLYSEIQKPEYYADEESPWTYLTQPAVLEYDDDPAKWKTLWPWTNRPPVSLTARDMVVKGPDGLYPMWPGIALNRKRAKMSPRNWSMVYMQEQVVEDAIFPADRVVGCIDGTRPAGTMSRGAPGHRAQGMDGLYVVGGFDPALTGHSAAVVLGVDRDTGVRWVLDVWTRANLKPDDLRSKIKEFTLRYNVHEWRIEKNAMNLMVTQDREIRTFLAARGTLLKEHFTGSNKWDADYGVASMSMLFENHESGRNLIRLPSRTNTEGVKSLVEQLCGWFPETKAKTDCVMALWFAEIRARELCDENYDVFHVENQYLSERDKENQVVVDLDYMSQRMFAGMGWSQI